MDKSILQEYLNLQFIPLEEDSALENLKKASTEIAKKLQKDKSKIISYTLIAIDPQTPVTDTVLQEVQEVVIKNWKVFATKASDRLTTYLRAVILEALQTIAENPHFAGIIWLTGSNAIPYYNLDRESETIKQWLEGIGYIYEEEAESQWNISSDVKIGSLDAISVNATIASTQVSSDTFTANLKAASSYTSHGGENPYYVLNNPQQWSDSFSTMIGQGFAKEINNALATQTTSLKKGLTSYNTQLNEYFEKLGTYFEGISKQMVSSTESMQRRSKLLWVKEALYSVSMKKSYREIAESTISDLPFILAKDMSTLITPIYPVSVDHFMKEILRCVIGNADEKVTLTSLLASDKLQCVIGVIGNEDIVESSRKPLINFIQRISNNQTFIGKLKEETGIDPESEITLANFTVYLLHGIQSIRLSNMK